MKTNGHLQIRFRAVCVAKRLLGSRSCAAFTLIELFVVVTTLAVLAAALLPALAASKDRGTRTQCANNQRQICVAIFAYVADNNDYMPPLKWRDANIQYPCEMFRYAPVNVPVNGTNSDYVPGGGPYDLGTLWQTGFLIDGKIYYCPGDVKNDVFSYNYYSQETGWPWGGNPAALNPGFVQSGYCYYPQSRITAAALLASGPPKYIPIWPSYNAAGSVDPYKTWICVPLFKLSDIDQTKSVVTDANYSGLSQMTHKSGNTPLGLNAGFGDGHVAWQGINQVTNGFNPVEWTAISSGSGPDFRYVQSCWQP